MTVEPLPAVVIKMYKNIPEIVCSGCHDVAKTKPILDCTPLPLASCSKFFIALAVGILHDRGILKFDQLISTWFSGIRAAEGGDQITVHHLLAHISGIPDIYCMPEWKKKWDIELDCELEIISALEKQACLKENILKLGVFDYSNSNYILLGEIIKRSIKTSLAQFIKEEIFEKIGMNNAALGWEGNPDDFPMRSVFIDGEKETDLFTEYRVNALHFDPFYTDGNIFASAQDMASFLNFGGGRSLVKKDTWNFLVKRTSEQSTFACGIREEKLGDTVFYRHFGYWLGFQSAFAFDSQGKNGFFIFDHREIEGRVDKLSNLYDNAVQEVFNSAK